MYVVVLAGSSDLHGDNAALYTFSSMGITVNQPLKTIFLPNKIWTVHINSREN